MCGIAGMFSQRGAVSSEKLARAVQTLHHRGPDGHKHWVSWDHRVALGHARLSIIDLPGGDQPIASEDEQLQIVVNGEFYDFQRIRGELEVRGHRFRTKSDSEIALHLYEEFGLAGLQQLRGEFAFALWDQNNQRLLLVRDRFGIKPLFYSMHQGTFYFASEIKALLALGVPSLWNHDQFYQNAVGAALPEGTLFDNVFQVPPGHFAVVSHGSLQVHRYWELSYTPANQLGHTHRTDQSWIEEFTHILEEAVRLRMHADVPVGCYLSGGIDSCAILGFAARNSDTPIEAFTLTFEQDAYNEGAIAQEMAARVDANFHPIPIRQSDIADHFSDAVFHSETIFWNGHAVSKYLLSRAVRDAGFKVVYTGEGSDEVLGGYVHFRADMLQHNTAGQDPVEVSRLLRELAAANTVSRGILLPEGQSEGLRIVERVLGFVPGWLQAWEASGARRKTLLSDSFAKQHATRDTARLFLDALDISGVLTGRDPLNKSLFLWAKSVLPNSILNFLGDRMEMAHSIEGRVPFLDHHVVEFLGRVPVHLKIRGLTEKYLLREAARPVITDTVYRRQKHPFLAPPATSAPTGRLHELMQDVLRGPELVSLPFYSQNKVIALLDTLHSLPAAERNLWDNPLMSVLCACLLQKRFHLS